ncbi:PREDICTED: dual oxidase-like [Priapulus caudatus]|uniref:Dual oxidase-like n=1 Tax=Priapulus caudatus TaxID=37621 RepID=A0ABM1DWF9_PRICU|nr:PREDICTED: dual oxidase-like [Priapulus caudatus]
MAFPLLRMLSVIFAISASPGTVKGMSMSHWQRYDGWYNNLVHPSWGSTGSTFVRKTPVSFADGVYKLAGENRPNARAVSELLFKGEDGLPSQLNRTTMLAFFGQVVAYEMLLGTEMTCPIEMHEVDMVTCTAADNCKSTGLSMPFHRVKYKHETGESVNNPRTQLNLVTSWIDASFVYNTKESIASSLRSFENGTFLSMMDGKYPAYNNIGIPTYNHYAPHLHHSMPIQETYRLERSTRKSGMPSLCWRSRAYSSRLPQMSSPARTG